MEGPVMTKSPTTTTVRTLIAGKRRKRRTLLTRGIRLMEATVKMGIAERAVENSGSWYSSAFERQRSAGGLTAFGWEPSRWQTLT